MNTRNTRERRHRLVLGTSLAVSLALHGVLFGALSFQPPEPAAKVPVPSAEMHIFPVPLIELVRIQEPPDPVVPDRVIADAPTIPTAPAEELSEPKSGDALAAAPGEAVASAAGAMGGAEAADDPFPVAFASAENGSAPWLPHSMKLRSGIQREMLESTRKPVRALDPVAHDDHAEGEGQEEDSWWRRLGAKFGLGDGNRICVPRPEVIAEDPEVAEK